MKTQMRGKQSGGFTLIELMIVIAIIAILVMMAVPAYKDFAVRAKIAECLNGAAVAKIQVSEYRQSLGDWPTSAAEAGIVLPSGTSHFCIGFSSYDPGTGAFTVDIDEPMVGINAGIVAPVFTPDELANGIINWACSYGLTPSNNVKYLPGPCRVP